MNKKDEQTMEAHGISRTTRDVYSYKGHKYDHLDDAVRYAEIDIKRARKSDGDS